MGGQGTCLVSQDFRKKVIKGDLILDVPNLKLINEAKLLAKEA